MTKAEKEIYEYGNKILKTGSDSFDWNYPYQYQHTERCIEVPWLASMLNKYKIKSLLDVGFTFASHDYLRLLLDWAKSCRLSGTDIINPQKVRGRYPEEWLQEINNIDIYINDISDVAISNVTADGVSLVSTMEHIGFDKESVTLPQSAFERGKDPSKVVKTRDESIEKKVLDNIAQMLGEGYCFISVPAGQGGAVMIKDSMGLYTCYWEYEENSWKKIVGHEKFRCIEQRFFIEKNKVWQETDSINSLRGVSAELKDYAAGLAVAVLQKK